jgi:hypothetical protein
MDGHTHDPVLKCSSQDERMVRLDGGSRATFTCGVMRQSYGASILGSGTDGVALPLVSDGFTAP